jgi:hypothetical protein
MYAQKNLFLLSLFFLPATFLHELCHFTVGLITFAKPISFNILPKKQDNSYVLGNVDFKNINFFNAFLTGLAPVLLIIGLYFLDKNNFALYKKIWGYIFNSTELNIVSFIILVYINYILIYSGIPSSQDFKVVFSHPIGLILWLIVIGIILFFFLYKPIVLKNIFG